MASSRALAASSRNTWARIFARSSEPSGITYSAPNEASIGGIATPPGAVIPCAIRSVSITGTPCAANRSAMVVLPLPIPPVQPMLNIPRLLQAQKSVESLAEQGIKRCTEKQRNCATRCEKRPEWQRFLEAHPTDHRRHQSDNRARPCREQHDLR